MRIEKKTLNDALRVLGKVVCQISPVELYRSVRFVGNADGITAMATDGGELRSDQGLPVLEAGRFCILRQKNYLMNFFHLFHLFSSISHSQ